MLTRYVSLLLNKNTFKYHIWGLFKMMAEQAIYFIRNFIENQNLDIKLLFTVNFLASLFLFRNFL